MIDGDLQFPPLPVHSVGSNLTELEQHLAALRANETDLTRHAVEVTLEHLTLAGVTPHKELADIRDWNGFGLYLMLTLSAAVERDSGGDTEWLRALMNELIKVSLANPIDKWLARLLEQPVRWGTSRLQEAILALLPPEAEPALQLIREWEEDDRRRWEEGAY